MADGCPRRSFVPFHLASPIFFPSVRRVGANGVGGGGGEEGGEEGRRTDGHGAEKRGGLKEPQRP